jgi:hypothetical protein
MSLRSNRHFHFSPWPIALCLGAIAMAVAVFSVTQSVQRREAHVEALNRQLLSEQQTLRVLDAEWAYLTRPQRLEQLMSMKRNIGVMPPVPTPVANIVPSAAVAPAAVEPASGEVDADDVAEKAEAPKPQIKAAAAPEKPAAKKAGVKKAEAKAPAEKKKIAAKSVNRTLAKTEDGVWHIAPKKRYAAPMPKTAALPVRAGVAHPILE